MAEEQKDRKPLPLIKFTDKFFDLLDEIKNPIARSIIEIESSALVFNGLRIEEVDISKQNWHFDVRIGDKIYPMKIGKFIQYYFKDTFDSKEIFDFQREYNSLKNGKEYKAGSTEYEKESKFKLIDSKEYDKKFDPKDIKSTFISLVTKTYPHGTEEGVVKYLPSDLNKDEFGNYYKIIGKSETMFTSHLDTADRAQTDTVLYEIEEKGETLILTDGNSILGADDKSGVTIMLYMMANGIPGVYYFFIGEERGGIGSGKVAEVFDSIPHLQNIKRCVSFDRRKLNSVITSQLGRQCCSDEFGNALAKELNKSGLDLSLDPTGIYTDSANFMDDIPECTNISVGYYNEHTVNEYQNMTYLEKLCKATLNVKWESLPTTRKVGFSQEMRSKYKNILSEIRRSAFYGEIKVLGEGGKALIKIDFESRQASIEEALDDLMSISTILTKNNIESDVFFSEEIIKIELR